MKKGVNVFLWILLVCCIFFLIFACTMTPKVEASNGVEYEPVDLSDIYSNQELTIELQIEGINNDNTENLVISFDIEI